MQYARDEIPIAVLFIENMDILLILMFVLKLFINDGVWFILDSMIHSILALVGWRTTTNIQKLTHFIVLEK